MTTINLDNGCSIASIAKNIFSLNGEIMMANKVKLCSILLLGATVSTAFTAAHAAESPPPLDASNADSLLEIVVTAQKRSESVQSVPISITVLQGEELQRQGVQTIVDLSRMTAALEFGAPGGAPGGGAFIRGIGTESVGGLTATASVSVVLDGVVLGNTNITDIFDIDHVEVLKGPQGTLFGSSVSAGVLSLTTNAPDPSAMSSTVSAEYGSGNLGSQYDRRSLRATANLPLSENSAVRVSLHSDDNTGVYFNTYENQKSEEPDNGARIRYLLKATDNFTVNLVADYNRYAATQVPVLTFRTLPAGNPVALAAAACGVTPSTSNFDFCSQYYNVRDQTDRGTSLSLDWDFGPASLTSITSYRLGDTASRGDIEALPLAIAQNYLAPPGCNFRNCVPIYAILPGGINSLQTQDRQQYSEELRLASNGKSALEWVGGVYFQHYRIADNEPGLINAIFTGGQFADTSFNGIAHAHDYAAFGNAVYHLTDSTRFIAGARYTHSSVSESKNDFSESATNLTYSTSGSAQKVSWRVGVQQDLPTSTMLYATIATGYKSPEIADTLTANPTSSSGGMYVISPELPTSFEVGAKQSFFDDRLAVDADVFYEHVKDYQGQGCTPNAQGTFNCVAASVPIVNTKGIEVDIFGRPVKGLTVNMSAILNPATYPGGYLGTDATNLGGKQLNYASKTKVTLSAEEKLPVTADYSAVIGADFTYRSQQSLYLSADPNFVAPAVSNFNARIGVASAKGWSAYLFGRNLSDSQFPRQLYPTPFVGGGYWDVYDANSKRLVGLQLQAKF